MFCHLAFHSTAVSYGHLRLWMDHCWRSDEILSAAWPSAQWSSVHPCGSLGHPMSQIKKKDLRWATCCAVPDVCRKTAFSMKVTCYARSIGSAILLGIRNKGDSDHDLIGVLSTVVRSVLQQHLFIEAAAHSSCAW